MLLFHKAWAVAGPLPLPLKSSRYQAEPRWFWPRSVYVHVPFCAHHCCYCDFAVVTGADRLADVYLDALEREMALWLAEPIDVETIYIGGGTPSWLSPARLRRLLTIIQQFCSYQRGNVEYTLEANPDDVTEEKLGLLVEFGVNRLSLGVQSFHPATLRFLERHHDPASIAKAIELALKHISNVSLDLIFAVPGQTLTDWHNDLARACQTGAQHLSTYNLTVEPKTALWARVRRGQVCPCDEETERSLYEYTITYLEDHGWEHYEISNFARPGYASRHNQVYWSGEAYLAFGLGAARYVGGTRSSNTRSLRSYLSQLRAGQLPIAESETLTPTERAAETAALQLRRRQGIHRDRFRQQTGFDLDTLLGSALRRHRNRGWLEDDGVTVRLSRQGIFYADLVCADCVASAQSSSR
ncbi:MAG: radical SAM family heme chaperone HemW [Gemmatales bacterium]|nr:radical SAM family heme chaperone HemW [Gemmatales bacterium]MDW7995536.1 radical SAM family heme chaperone HemW [Gemmatales bacterium]